MKGKLRRPKFLTVHHIKRSYYRLGKKDKDENKKCMRSYKDMVEFLLLRF